MGGIGSGGHNKLTIEEHKRRGTYRFDRDRERAESEAGPVKFISASPAETRRTLRGLPPEARWVAKGILDEFGGFDAGSLLTLRSYALSCWRIGVMEAGGGEGPRLQREIRLNLALRRGLEIDK